MSGGSFNYASTKDIEAGEPSEDHVALVDALADYPGTEAVRARALAVLEKWRQAAAIMREVDEEWSRLRPVLKAVEWERSCDYGPEEVARAVDSFNP